MTFLSESWCHRRVRLLLIFLIIELKENNMKDQQERRIHLTYRNPGRFKKALSLSLKDEDLIF